MLNKTVEEVQTALEYLHNGVFSFIQEDTDHWEFTHTLGPVPPSTFKVKKSDGHYGIQFPSQLDFTWDGWVGNIFWTDAEWEAHIATL
jgi:hypothetical protein